MDNFYVNNKCRLMNTLEKFQIFRETKINNQINDRRTVKHNTIFYVIVNMFENRVLRRVFGSKRDEVTGEWRKLHND